MDSPLSSYYDIDAILAEEEATPVQFRIDACKLGYLDSGSVDDDVGEKNQKKKNTKKRRLV